MRCPKCSFNSFDYNDACPKCGRDLSPTRQMLGLLGIKPEPISFLSSLIGDEEGEYGEFTFEKEGTATLREYEYDGPDMEIEKPKKEVPESQVDPVLLSPEEEGTETALDSEDSELDIDFDVEEDEDESASEEVDYTFEDEELDVEFETDEESEAEELDLDFEEEGEAAELEAEEFDSEFEEEEEVDLEPELDTVELKLSPDGSVNPDEVSTIEDGEADEILIEDVIIDSESGESLEPEEELDLASLDTTELKKKQERPEPSLSDITKPLSELGFEEAESISLDEDVDDIEGEDVFDFEEDESEEVADLNLMDELDMVEETLDGSSQVTPSESEGFENLRMDPESTMVINSVEEETPVESTEMELGELQSVEDDFTLEPTEEELSLEINDLEIDDLDEASDTMSSGLDADLADLELELDNMNEEESGSPK